MSSIVVIGATSFAGQALIPQLLERGHQLHVVSRTAHAPTRHPRLQQHCGLFSDPAFMGPLLQSCDILIHLASATTPGTSARTPTREADANIAPTAQLIEMLQHHPAIHVLYISSGGAIYGNPDTPLVTENAPCRPVSYYGAGKLSIESFLRVLHTNHGNRVTVLRPSNFYGPGQPQRRGFGLIRTILDHLFANQPVQIWGDGSAVRDFLYIGDFVDASLAAIAPTSNDHRLCVYNVGTGRGYSLNEICAIVEEVTGITLQKQYRPARSSDVKKIVLDPTLIATELGWHAQTDITTGIEATWQWLRTTGR